MNRLGLGSWMRFWIFSPNNDSSAHVHFWLQANIRHTLAGCPLSVREAIQKQKLSSSAQKLAAVPSGKFEGVSGERRERPQTCNNRAINPRFQRDAANSDKPTNRDKQFAALKGETEPWATTG